VFCSETNLWTAGGRTQSWGSAMRLSFPKIPSGVKLAEDRESDSSSYMGATSIADGWPSARGRARGRFLPLEKMKVKDFTLISAPNLGTFSILPPF
jgi:hypothetical protein